MNRTLKITLIILIVLIAGCTSCAYWAYKQISVAQGEIDPIIEKALADLNSGNYDAFYNVAKISDPSVDREKFNSDLAKEMDNIGTITNHSQLNFNVRTFNTETVADESYTLQGSKGAGTAYFNLKKISGWEISGFTITHTLGK